MLEPDTPRGSHVPPEPTAIEKRSVPWFMMILVGGLVFLLGHRLDFSVAPDLSSHFGTAAEAIARGSARRRLGFFLLGVWGSIAIVFQQPRYKLQLNGLLPWLALGFLFWAGLSVFWAADLALAFRRFVMLGMVSVASIAVLRRLSLREIILFITLASLVYVLIGVVAEIAYGTFQPFSAGYRFSGTLHPNIQGMNLAAVVLGAVCLSRMRIAGRWLFVAIAAVGLVLLVLTRSRTAFGATLIALAMFAGVRMSPLRLTAMLLSVSAIGLLALFLIQNGVLSTPWEVILMGRNEVLTEGTRKLSGRTELWEYLWTFAIERPVLGYGYNAFMSPARAGEMPRLVAWGVSETHNLYLEVLLGTGTVGLVLFSTVLFGSLGRAFRWTMRFRAPAYALLTAYLVFVAVNGLLVANTIWPDPKLIGFLVLGYVLLRDPELDVTKEEPASAGHLGRAGMTLHSAGGSGVSEWPVGISSHYPGR